MSGWGDYTLKDINDEKKRAEICGVSEDEVRKGVNAIVLTSSLEESAKKAQEIYERGQWPKFYFTNKGKGGVRRKTYLDSVGGIPPTNLWQYSDVGHTDEAAKALKSIFGGSATFDTPKPSRLVERVLQIATNKDSIILDSFAGSGTTAHAVLNMNTADGGNRKFILVEMMDYANSITAERVKRVIDGYGDGKKAVEGTGGDFTFYDLGQALLLPDGNLNEEVDTDKIREYIWYAETKMPFVAVATDNPYYLGKHNDTGYYFYYEKERLTTLNYEWLATISEKADGYLIYADLCTIPDDELKNYNITFKKIPRDIARL